MGQCHSQGKTLNISPTAPWAIPFYHSQESEKTEHSYAGPMQQVYYWLIGSQDNRSSGRLPRVDEVLSACASLSRQLGDPGKQSALGFMPRGHVITGLKYCRTYFRGRRAESGLFHPIPPYLKLLHVQNTTFCFVSLSLWLVLIKSIFISWVGGRSEHCKSFSNIYFTRANKYMLI